MINTDQYCIYFVINKNPTFIGNSLSFPYQSRIKGSFASQEFQELWKYKKKKKRNVHPMNFYPILFQLRVVHMQINYRTASIAWNLNKFSVFCFGSFTLFSLSLLVFLFRFAYHYVGRLLWQRSNFTHLTVYVHSVAKQKKSIDYFYGFSYFTIRDLQSSNVPYMLACFFSSF